ncbi:MAG: hypothetical protein AAGJ81_01685 [Verrucomicrobiota bacterium]
MRTFFKWVVIAFGILVLLLAALVFWMRAGEEEPLDYSALAVELGPDDPEVNGFAYLKSFLNENDPEIPGEFISGYSDDDGSWTDYRLYENWDLNSLQQIVLLNQEFIRGVETAFNRPVFLPDQEFSLANYDFGITNWRKYGILRIFEARALHLSGKSKEAFDRLAILADELKVVSQTGGALLGLIVNLSLLEDLVFELATYQEHVFLPAINWKSFASGFDYEQALPNAFDHAIRQEFQFIFNTLKIAAEGIPDSPARTSKPQLTSQRLLSYVGLRKNRTINEVFLVFLEQSNEAKSSAKERTNSNTAKLSARLDNRAWSDLLNRNPYGEILLTILFPALDATVDRFYFTKTNLSATRISMALQSYYLDQGDLPGNLEDLVPDYLSSIPRDPYDGEPLRYSKEKRIVYSVGNDFFDQGGSDLPFRHVLPEEEDDSEAAEYDHSEPTFPLRFL